jgi:hypothetical protein
MKRNRGDTSLTPTELSLRWSCHRASVPRIMARFGFSGLKFGESKQCARRYSREEVEMVEKLARIKAGVSD